MNKVQANEIFCKAVYFCDEFEHFCIFCLLKMIFYRFIKGESNASSMSATQQKEIFLKLRECLTFVGFTTTVRIC